MATNCCSPVKFYCLNEKTFYFVDAETDGDLVDDSFAKSVYQACGLLIRGNNNKFLVLSDENEFKAQTLTGTQPECKFNIQFYNDSTLDGRNGRPVMLYANKANGKKMMVSCNDRHEIVPEEMEQLPAAIGVQRHSAVFYRTEVPFSKSNYMLESSMYQNNFLGFKQEESNHTLSKLVLFPVGKDEVDDRCVINFSQ
ncbi:uncharacterized protein LOC115597488 isoform X1 [Sparus aurata]|uniref:uncharacterized protein LOC115597488 isoform X1 n=1 Tax=Sparus aurata TaxID=8175 RepID=UPI0011C11F77|nr:uncharacterized protein LOC115597488 isoform X1 [Sparus aurata]